jgi:hypothetical protein
MVSARLRKIASQVRRGQSANAFADLSETLEELGRVVAASKIEALVASVLRRALIAQTREDLLLLADILEYELVPLLDSGPSGSLH